MMKKFSRQIVFINTSPPEERVVLLKPSTVLEALKDDDDDIQCSNLISRYSERPRSMTDMTLAEFASYYEKKAAAVQVNRSKQVDHLLPEPYDSENEDKIEEENIEEPNGPVEQLDVHNDGEETTLYRRRKTPRFLRSVHFNPDTDAEKYYRELIMLYFPWTDESTLKGDHDSYCDRFKEIEHQVLDERQKYEPYADEVDTAQTLVSQGSGLDNAWDDLAPHTEHNNAMDEANKPTQKDAGIENYDLAADLGLPVSNAMEELHKYYELPDEKYRQHMRSLNQEQLEFLYDTIHLIKTSSNPVYRFLSGGAGVGKSFVTRGLYQTALKYLNKKAGESFTTRRILLLAPTGKAAYHIHGTTIHSALKIMPNKKLVHKPLQSSALNTLRTEIGGVKLIFIDEISLVGFNMFNCIHQRLVEVMQNALPFGGVSVIAVGDLFQLKPVMDSYIFSPPGNGYLPLATTMWQDIFPMFELKKIMRQADHKAFAELLNRLREGKQTTEDIEALNQRKITKDAPNYPCDATHLFTNNRSVDTYNAQRIQMSKKPLYTFKAKDRVVASSSPEMKAKILETFRNNSTHTTQLPNAIQVSEGITYDVTVNLNTSDGLINGATCRMMKVDALQTEMLASGVLWVQFDDADIGSQLRTENRRLYRKGCNKDWTPIQPVVKQFAAGYKGQAQVQRYQFPLRPSHAKTIHRSQGDTMKSAAIDLTTPRKVDHIHYVAISRLVSLEGLHLLNLQEDKISISNDVKREMERLRSLPSCITHVPLTSIPCEFKVVFLNARSQNRHLQDIKQDENIQTANIACFCESRFCERDSVQDTSIGDFHQYRQDHNQTTSLTRPSYGMTVHSACPFDKEPVNETSDNIEVTVFTVKDHTDKVFVTVYKSPSTPVKVLCKKLRQVYDKYLQNTTSVVLGDFNVDWASRHRDKTVLEELMVTQLGYKQMIVGPTTDNHSTLDLVFTNMDADVISGTCETYYYDHKIIWIGW
jgi:hypothetical protein